MARRAFVLEPPERAARGRQPAGAGLKEISLARPARNYGSKACRTFLTVGARRAKSTDTVSHKGDEAGKQVSGIRLPLAADRQDLPHATAVTTANVIDRKGALAARKRCKRRLRWAQNPRCDNRYAGRLCAQGVQDVGASA